MKPPQGLEAFLALMSHGIRKIPVQRDGQVADLRIDAEMHEFHRIAARGHAVEGLVELRQIAKPRLRRVSRRPSLDPLSFRCCIQVRNERANSTSFVPGLRSNQV